MKKKYDEAIVNYTKAIQSNPNDGRYYYNRGKEISHFRCFTKLNRKVLGSNGRLQ